VSVGCGNASPPPSLFFTDALLDGTDRLLAQVLLMPAHPVERIGNREQFGERFLTQAWEERAWEEAEPDRVLATVLFTDLVGSTAKAVELGPRWRELLREHNAVIRHKLAQYRGREIDTAGDGFFASGFDGPARAIRCACAIRDAVKSLGLKVRVVVHTGEREIVDGKLSGLAVVIGSRIAAQADDGEVLVSGTVRDLVAGSGITFETRGTRELKGLGEWPLFAISGLG
jgi:class 3 adenylate cyclase